MKRSSDFDNGKDEESAMPLLEFDGNSDGSLPPTPVNLKSGVGFRKRTPLPLLQLTILCGVRLAEPIAYTQIFPYINQMIEELKVTDQPAQIGYYSGMVDSIFAVCQLFTIFQWAKLSDRIGRKPVILIGLTGVAISTSLFGFSKSLAWAIFSRSLAGALSGNVAVVESVIAEITDETNQAQAYPLKGVSWNLGVIIGPVVGGNMATPSKQWPNTFGKIPILIENPYLLPCVISALITVVAILFGLVFMKESLPSKMRNLPRPIQTSKPKISAWSIATTPVLWPVLQNYFILSIIGTSFDVVFVLMAYTPVNLGGLSRTPADIGFVLAFSGLAGATLQVFAFPWLQRKYNYIPLYRVLMMLWPLAYILIPCLNFIARMTMPPELTDTPDAHFPAGFLVWLGMMLILAVQRIAAMSYAVNTILVRNAAPSSEALGATFGLSQSVACVARAGAPAFVSSVFALSKRHQIMGGNFVWVVMVVISLLGLWSTYHVVDGAEVKRGYQVSDDEE